MRLNIDLVDTNKGELAGCLTTFGEEDGLFAISTARIPKSSPTFTYIEANFFLFVVRGVTYGLTFGPDDDGAIDDDSKWPPPNTGDMSSLTGSKLKLRAPKGPQKKGPCNGIITQNWEILVTKN